jgi:hypothetical protein
MTACTHAHHPVREDERGRWSLHLICADCEARGVRPTMLQGIAVQAAAHRGTSVGRRENCLLQWLARDEQQRRIAKATTSRDETSESVVVEHTREAYVH